MIEEFGTLHSVLHSELTGAQGHGSLLGIKISSSLSLLSVLSEYKFPYFPFLTYFLSKCIYACIHSMRARLDKLNAFTPWLVFLGSTKRLSCKIDVCGCKKPAHKIPTSSQFLHKVYLQLALVFYWMNLTLCHLPPKIAVCI